MNQPSPDDFLSPDEVAALLQNRYTSRSVQSWCQSGKLPASRVGRKWLIRRADFEAFVRNGGEVKEGKANALAA
jgi:excisionase family DNA binding protein